VLSKYPEWFGKIFPYSYPVPAGPQLGDSGLSLICVRFSLCVC